MTNNVYCCKRIFLDSSRYYFSLFPFTFHFLKGYLRLIFYLTDRMSSPYFSKIRLLQFSHKNSQHQQSRQTILTPVVLSQVSAGSMYYNNAAYSTLAPSLGGVSQPTYTSATSAAALNKQYEQRLAEYQRVSADFQQRASPEQVKYPTSEQTKYPTAGDQTRYPTPEHSKYAETKTESARGYGADAFRPFEVKAEPSRSPESVAAPQLSLGYSNEALAGLYQQTPAAYQYAGLQQSHAAQAGTAPQAGYGTAGYGTAATGEYRRPLSVLF